MSDINLMRWLRNKTQKNSEQLADIMNELITGEVGKKYKIVACVIRNDGTGWKLVPDAGHTNINVASVTNDTNYITVNFGFIAKNVVSFVACPDEEFVSIGYFIGSSVGTNYAKIRITKSKLHEVGGYIVYDGTNWVVNGAVGNLVVTSFTSGILLLTHDDVGTTYNANVTPRDTGYKCSLGSLSGTLSRISFYNSSGTLVTTPDTNMKFYFSRTMGLNSIDIINPSTIIDASGNIWCMGIFEVN